MRRLTALLVALSVALVACGGADTAQVTLVGPSQASDLIASQDEVVILDVRTAEEVAAGALPGAVNIDFYSPSFSDQLARLDPNETYFVYCRSGNRSREATASMIDLGFTDVYELDGGIVAWIDSGLGLEG